MRAGRANSRLNPLTEIIGLRLLSRLPSVNEVAVLRDYLWDHVQDVRVGDHVILHVGYALSKLDPEEAERTLEAMRTPGVLEETLAELEEGTA